MVRESNPIAAVVLRDCERRFHYGPALNEKAYEKTTFVVSVPGVGDVEASIAYWLWYWSKYLAPNSKRARFEMEYWPPKLIGKFQEAILALATVQSAIVHVEKWRKRHRFSEEYRAAVVAYMREMISSGVSTCGAAKTVAERNGCSMASALNWFRKAAAAK